MGETAVAERVTEKTANGVEHAAGSDGEAGGGDRKASGELQQLLKEAHEKSFTTTNRLRETGGIIVWVVMTVIMGAQLYVYRENGSLLGNAIGAFLGLMAADLLTGIIHWTFDTWGDTSTPVFGKTAILLFREHHVIPQAFTHRDFITTWGEPCIVVIGIVGIPFLFSLIVPNIALTLGYYFYCGQIVFFTSGAAHNQIHKWAHMTQYPVPRIIKWMQNWHLLISREHHHEHHKPPHLVHYCLITGWPNYPLDFFKVWRGLEWLIEHTTSLKARADDMKSD